MILKIDVGNLETIVTVLIGVVTTAFGIIKYLSRRDKQIATRQVFREVVESLSSDSEVQRLGAAILLRRFLDPETELGQGRTPYARETIDVMAAILRETKTGNFQKLLADGLRYAPTLEGADLQRTNLQKAYLGNSRDRIANINKADFYRSDLSGASLKGASVVSSVFYQARMHNTVLRNADLSHSNFFEADLLGADFRGAKLDGAVFLGARNLPNGLSKYLSSDGVYSGPIPFETEKPAEKSKTINVFLSMPGILNDSQRKLVDELVKLLSEENLSAVTVSRDEYPGFGAVSEVRRVMSGCCGSIVIGLSQLEVKSGVWRAGTKETKNVDGISMPSVWNHIEAGMAAMAGLPILFIVEKGVAGGLFELEDIDNFIVNIDLYKLDHQKIQEAISSWSQAVRELSH